MTKGPGRSAGVEVFERVAPRRPRKTVPPGKLRRGARPGRATSLLSSPSPRRATSRRGRRPEGRRAVRMLQSSQRRRTTLPCEEVVDGCPPPARKGAQRGFHIGRLWGHRRWPHMRDGTHSFRQRPLQCRRMFLVGLRGEAAAHSAVAAHESRFAAREVVSSKCNPTERGHERGDQPAARYGTQTARHASWSSKPLCSR